MSKSKLGGTGLEQGAKTPDETAISTEGAAKSGASDGKSAAFGPDLRSTVEAWPTLPDALKTGILAMVRASEQGD
ncbi:MAG: hypothetical protein KKB50_19870 [Planctomycetes bacterium]|nr:hypothetical protein [Planctomycetota bacterium]